MAEKHDETKWLFVIIQNPGRSEQFFGLEDPETGVAYIPAFRKKEHAQDCLIHLPTQRGTKYEPQAVVLSDLTRDAFANNFFVFVLDGECTIIEKIFPDHPDSPVH